MSQRLASRWQVHETGSPAREKEHFPRSWESGLHLGSSDGLSLAVT